MTCPKANYPRAHLTTPPESSSYPLCAYKGANPSRNLRTGKIPGNYHFPAQSLAHCRILTIATAVGLATIRLKDHRKITHSHSSETEDAGLQHIEY